MESNKSSSIGKLALLFLALFIFTILLAYHATAAIPTATLWHYYSFDNDTTSGTTCIDDLNTFNGTIENGATTGLNCVVGECYRYDGTNDQVRFGSDGWGDFDSNNMSYSLWVNFDTVVNSLSTFVSVGTASGGEMEIGSSAATGTLSTQHYDNGWDAGNPTVPIAAGAWVHVVMTCTNTQTLYYVNGTLNRTEAIGCPDGDSGRGGGCDSPPYTYFGHWCESGVQYFDGFLDEFGIWNQTLSASQVLELFNNGSGIAYPFAAGPGATTDIDFTAVDDFNGSSINTFAINVSWPNGSITTHNTTNGTISLVNISQSSISINVSYFNATDYFNQTLLNQSITANTTNSVQASMYQAVASLSAFEKITNNSLSGVTFYIGSKSGTEFNLTAGTHSVTAERAGYYNLTGSITVAALSNTSYNLEGMYNTIVNFTAYNAIDNSSISNFQIDIDFGESVSTTNGTVFINAINNTNYTFNISSAGAFTSRFNLSFIANASTYNVNTSLFTFNSIRFNIFNESSMAALLQAVTIHTISNLTTFSNTTATGFIVIDLLQPNEYEIRFESTGFNPRSIFLTVTNDSTQNVTVYMTENTTTELQRIEVLDTANQPVEGAIVWLQKEHINETDRWITIQEAQTDYNGETSVFVERDVTIFYRFAVIYESTARPIQPSGNLFTGPTTFIPGITETIQLIIDLEDDPEDFISDDLAISFDCNMTNTTAVCSIIDGRNSITGAELRLEAAYINETLAWESIQNDSFTGSSGTLQVNLTAINNSIWRARAYLIYESSENLIWEDEFRFDIDVIIEKNTGLLYAVLILAVVFGLTVMWGPLPSGIVGVCALIPLTAIKLISLPIGVITGLLAIVVIFFFRTRKTTTE